MPAGGEKTTYKSEVSPWRPSKIVYVDYFLTWESTKEQSVPGVCGMGPVVVGIRCGRKHDLHTHSHSSITNV